MMIRAVSIVGSLFCFFLRIELMGKGKADRVGLPTIGECSIKGKNTIIVGRDVSRAAISKTRLLLIL